MTFLKIIVVFFLVAFWLSGCAEFPIKHGGLAIGNNTTASIDDVGVGRLTSQF